MAESLSTMLSTVRPDLSGADLDATLRAFVASARSAWPTVDLDDASFIAHVAEHLPRGSDVLAELTQLSAAGLYLACACAHGLPAAIACFERELLVDLDGIFARIDRSPDFIAEARQRLRERVLVGPKPRINDYSGSGPLGAWLRVAATRVALNLRRDTGRQDKRTLPVAAPALDPEAQAIKGQYRDELATALRAAFAALDDEQRKLLRLHYVEGRTLEEIARRLGVVRSNASRRVAAARQQLLEATRHELGRLAPGLTPSSRDSLIQVLHSQIEITLQTLLAP